MEELKKQLRIQLEKFNHPYPFEKQQFLETETFKALTKKTRDLGTDFIYWWNPAERELPPVNQE